MTNQEGYNGFDGDQIKGYLDEIAVADNELLSLKSDYMLKCKGPRAQIREIMAAAKEAGTNMKALREVVADDRTRRRRERRIAALEADDLQDYEAMCEALGDYGTTPLGAAALKRAKANEDALNSLGA
jgi:F0F1-type ATP synthase membrane subunit b/b'